MQMGLDASHQFFLQEWFVEVVGCSHAEERDDGIAVVVGRQEYYWQFLEPKVFTDFQAKFVAVHLNHVQVGEHQVNLVVLQELQGRGAIIGHVDGHAQALQTHLNEHAGGGTIIHHQNLHAMQFIALAQS